MPIPFVVGGGLAVTSAVAYNHRSLGRQGSTDSQKSTGKEQGQAALQVLAATYLRELRDQVTGSLHISYSLVDGQALFAVVRMESYLTHSETLFSTFETKGGVQV